MSKTVSLISAVSRLLATLIVGFVVAVSAWVGWQVYRHVTAKERAEAQLADAQKKLEQAEKRAEALAGDLEQAKAQLVAKAAEIRQLTEKVERLETSLRLLKVTHRVARLSILDQTTDPETGRTFTLVRFEEINDEGRPLGQPRDFRIEGDVIYLDSWVVKFEDKYIEQADIDRSTSLVLFRRIFGEHQQPKDGFELDQQGLRPLAYAQGGAMTEFERRIWEDFWNIANDPKKAAELGIRAAHGEAPSIKARKGMVYRVVLRASDGLSISAEQAAPPMPDAT
ncbi:MAG: hypothetical protein KatS3mg110_3402 [Pirellulaceae bacterium]|nr:MAG: hypothetical protein KatS3mg110_3402 [Pirellulaceae bacterium]